MPALKRKFRPTSRLLESLESRILFSFGVTTGTAPTGQPTYVIDNGSDVQFSIVRGGTLSSTLHMADISSIKFKGQEILAPYSTTSRYSHYEQGLGTATNITYTIGGNNSWILVSCDDSSEASGAVIQYFAVRKGDDNIYMASLPLDVNNGPGEGRMILYLNSSVFPNPEPPSNNAGTTGAIEGSDVYGHADGTTTSKFYNMNREMIDNIYHGLTGTSGGQSVGAWMFMGNRETSSGGPFFKDIDYQGEGSWIEMYNCLFTGHTQTEPFRQGLKGPYALQLNAGATPTTPDYSWLETMTAANGTPLIKGLIPAAQRGNLTGLASGVPAGDRVTVGLANSAAQYWGTPSANGTYSITGILPGTYTETLYDKELEVGTKTITITAGNTASANIIDTYYNPANPIFRIGTWDGTPLGFLNTQPDPTFGLPLISIMHPSDIRMSSWTSTPNFTIGTNTDSQWPSVQFMGVNNNEQITFNLTAAQVQNLTLRVGITWGFSGARPKITVNSGTWTSVNPSASADLNSRGITRGTWRGVNQLYTYDIPASAFVVGTNTISLPLISGSYVAGQTWLSPNVAYDAIDLVPTTTAYAPTIASVIVTPSSTSVGPNGTETFTAVAKDANGNIIPANFSFSAARGTIDQNGNYIAPPTGGPDTISVTALTTSTPGYRNSTSRSNAFTGFVSAAGSSNITITGFGVLPTTATLLPGSTLQLVAGTYDSSGNVTPAANATWSILSGPGSVSNTGLFLASSTPGAVTTIQVNSPGNPTAISTLTIASATAWYTADVSNGATLTDSSANNQNATLTGAYSYTPGISSNALTLSGGYATLPAGIVSTTSDFTIATWINVGSLANWARVFDFGTGTTSYMFLTPDAGTSNALRFAITTSGGSGEQQLNGPKISPNTWTHVAITLSGTLATLYVNGNAVATNSNMTLHPSSLGNTTLNYLGKSQFPDPAFNGAIDDFRIYPTALSAQQINELAYPALLAPASAPSNITNVATTSLSVQATDVTAGEPALTYTWSAIGNSPAPVTFTNNGTNAGKNTTATFTVAGIYTLQVSIKNPAANLTTTSTLTLTVFPGDANRDGKIDSTDLNIIFANFGAVTTSWTAGNFDGSPTVNLTDMAFVLNNMGTTLAAASAPAATASPAPAATLPPTDPTPATPTTDTISTQLLTPTPPPTSPSPTTVIPPPPPHAAPGKPKPHPKSTPRKPSPMKPHITPKHPPTRGHH